MKKLEIKLSNTQIKLFEYAAELSGYKDLSDFVVQTVQKKVEKERTIEILRKNDGKNRKIEK